MTFYVTTYSINYLLGVELM